eukprot:UN4304
MIRQPPLETGTWRRNGLKVASACNSQGKAVDKFPIPILNDMRLTAGAGT